ncbi:MAG: hypothetical protein KAY59_01375 [Acidobacteria bacterium]|nr:hypothetical protein [Acidobacteriota bacterium]MBP8273048.1 hypothetical protein [Acidobacteriota bacterium]
MGFLQRAALLGGWLVVGVSVCGCGSTPTSPTPTFALGAGAYSLKIGGGGSGVGAPVPNVCLIAGAEIAHEGVVPVVVTQAGETWTVKPSGAADKGFTMTFTSSGVATGTVRGEATGSLLETSSNLAIDVTNAAVDGRNSGSTAAGGQLTGTVRITSGVGVYSCTLGNWTLTPR